MDHPSLGIFRSFFIVLAYFFKPQCSIFSGLLCSRNDMQRTQGATYLWMGRSHIHSRGRVVFFVALYCCDAVHIDAGKVCCNCNLGHGSHITYSVVDDLGIPCLVRRARHSPSLVLFIIIVDLHRRKVPWFWKNLLILSRATT